jgi:hypothetical protein
VEREEPNSVGVQHLVLKYYGDLHRYIQTEMDFLNISSLGVAYRYAVKIEQKFSTRKNGISGLQIRNNQSMVKMALTNSLLTTSLRQMKIRVKER